MFPSILIELLCHPEPESRERFGVRDLPLNFVRLEPDARVNSEADDPTRVGVLSERSKSKELSCTPIRVASYSASQRSSLRIARLKATTVHRR